MHVKGGATYPLPLLLLTDCTTVNFHITINDHNAQSCVTTSHTPQICKPIVATTTTRNGNKMNMIKKNKENKMNTMNLNCSDAHPF